MPYPIFRIMVSSTFLDLAPERAAVVKALRDLNLPLCSLGIALTPIDLQEGASTQPPLDVCLAEARQADLVITILGLRNGWVTPNNRSITECEFDEARAASRDVLAYFKRPESVTLPEHTEKDPGGQKSLAAFKKKIDSQLKRDVFSDSSELRGHVIRDILSWALFRPEILSKFCRDPNAPSFTKIKEYLEVINSTNIEATVNTVCSRKFTLDMHRFGVEELHRATLTDLLELRA